MATRTERNEVCQKVLDWQTERGLEGWNEDSIRHETGIQAINGNTLLLEDDSRIDTETDIEVVFKEGKHGSYKLDFDKETGLYSISKSSTRKKSDAEDTESDDTEGES